MILTNKSGLQKYHSTLQVLAWYKTCCSLIRLINSRVLTRVAFPFYMNSKAFPRFLNWQPSTSRDFRNTITNKQNYLQANKQPYLFSYCFQSSEIISFLKFWLI